VRATPGRSPCPPGVQHEARWRANSISVRRDAEHEKDVRQPGRGWIVEVADAHPPSADVLSGRSSSAKAPTRSSAVNAMKRGADTGRRPLTRHASMAMARRRPRL
jgi:hypothetical protein